jgi:hypothetical protein
VLGSLHHRGVRAAYAVDSGPVMNQIRTCHRKSPNNMINGRARRSPSSSQAPALARLCLKRGPDPLEDKPIFQDSSLARRGSDPFLGKAPAIALLGVV